MICWVPTNMAQTATNVVAHEQLYRLGFSAAVIVVSCNLPLGWICFELFKVVNPRLALLALIFITTSATIEAVNLFNYITPLFTFTLPEYIRAFDAGEIQALARGQIRLFGYGFSVALVFFSVFCVLMGYLILRSRFLPAILGLLMIAAGVIYCIENFALFLALPNIPYIGWVHLAAEFPGTLSPVPGPVHSYNGQPTEIRSAHLVRALTIHGRLYEGQWICSAEPTRVAYDGGIARRFADVGGSGPGPGACSRFRRLRVSR
jgi:hypothetical protein